MDPRMGGVAGVTIKNKQDYDAYNMRTQENGGTPVKFEDYLARRKKGETL